MHGRAPVHEDFPFSRLVFGGCQGSNQGRHTRFYDNRRAKTPLIPGDVRTGTSQVSFHRLCTHDLFLSLFLSLFRCETSFVSRQRSSSCSWIVGGAARLEVYDLENPGDRIIGNDDNPLERICEGIRSLWFIFFRQDVLWCTKITRRNNSDFSLKYL